MRVDDMPADEQRLQAELPEFLDLLENVAGYVGGLDLAKVGEMPAEAFLSLRDGLHRALGFLEELSALRGEPPPSPEPGIAFGALGPSLRRTLPQRLAAQLADELNALTGSRLEDVSQYAAFGLAGRVADLLRFVAYVMEQQAEAARLAAPPTLMSTRRPRPQPAKSSPAAPDPSPAAPDASPAPAAPGAAKVPQPARRKPSVPEAPVPAPVAATPPSPSPGGPGPDLSAYGIRIDEAGERIQAGSATVWFAAAPGPHTTGEGRAASFSVSFPGGVAFAVAEGAESSLGARLASVVAVRAFCRAAAANPTVPEAALRMAQSHLDMLLSAILSAGDATDAFTRVRGNTPAATARRILRHTREPEEALRRVMPALSTSLLGAVAALSGSTVRVSAVRLGAGLVDARISGRVTPILGIGSGETVPLLGPGGRGADDARRAESTAPVSLSPRATPSSSGRLHSPRALREPGTAFPPSGLRSRRGSPPARRRATSSAGQNAGAKPSRLISPGRSDWPFSSRAS